MSHRAGTVGELEDESSIWHDVESVSSEESFDDERDFLEQISREQLAVAKGEVTLSNLLDSAVGHRLQDVEDSSEDVSDSTGACMPKEISTKEILRPSLVRGVWKSVLALIVLVVTLLAALATDYWSHGAVFQHTFFQHPTAVMNQVFVPMEEVFLADKHMHKSGSAQVGVLACQVGIVHTAGEAEDSSSAAVPEDGIQQQQLAAGATPAPTQATGLPEVEVEGLQTGGESEVAVITVGVVALPAAVLDSVEPRDGEEGLSPGSGGPEERSVGNVSGVALAHDLSVDHPEGARGGQPVLLVVVLLGLLCMYAANALRKPPSRGADQSPPERSVRFPWGDDTPSPGSNTSSTPTTPSPTTAAAADGMMGILHITPANPPEGRSRDSDMATPAKYSLRRSASAVKRKRGAGHS